jgi:2-keto-4-pentenoate hydratase
LYEVTALSYIDDEFVGRGVTSIRHGPLGALAFTLAKCARRGRPLQAGAVISTGMITGVHDIRPGQRSRHVFQGFGEVGCRAVRATPHPQRA